MCQLEDIIYQIFIFNITYVEFIGKKRSNIECAMTLEFVMSCNNGIPEFVIMR